MAGVQICTLCRLSRPYKAVGSAVPLLASIVRRIMARRCSSPLRESPARRWRRGGAEQGAVAPRPSHGNLTEPESCHGHHLYPYPSCTSGRRSGGGAADRSVHAGQQPGQCRGRVIGGAGIGRRAAGRSGLDDRIRADHRHWNRQRDRYPEPAGPGDGCPGQRVVGGIGVGRRQRCRNPRDCSAARRRRRRCRHPDLGAFDLAELPCQLADAQRLRRERVTHGHAEQSGRRWRPD